MVIGRSPNRVYMALSLMLMFVVFTALHFVSLPGTKQLRVVALLQTNYADTYQLFYDTGGDFNEAQSVIANVVADKQAQRIEFRLPLEPVTRLRLDVGYKAAATIQIQSAHIEYSYRSVSLMAAFKPNQLNDISDFQINGGSLELTTSGTDPFLYTGNISDLYSTAVHGTVTNRVFAQLLNLLVSLLAAGTLYVYLMYNKPGIPGVMRSGKTSLATVVLFLSLLGIPFTLNLIYRTDELFYFNENRTLAPKPVWSLKEWTDYPKRYEAYFNDHFALRSLFIRLNNYIRVKRLGISTADHLTVGKDGWLYSNWPQTTDDYKGLVRFSDNELLRIKHNLEDWSARMRSKRIHFLLVIVPVKITVYSEFLQSTVQKVNAETRTDQLLEYLKASGSTIDILDLRPLLLSNKKDGLLYFKADTHWNDTGAFLGYQAIVNRLGQQYPLLKPKPINEFTITERKLPGPYYLKDLARNLGLSTMYEDRYLAVTPNKETASENASVDKRSFPNPPSFVARQTGDSSLPNVVMFRDSFTESLVPLLSEHFNKSYYVWDNAFHMEVVERVKPDIVIYELSEQFLPDLLKGSL